MTWMNLGYMVLGVVFWNTIKMFGDIASDIGRRARIRRSKRHFYNRYKTNKIVRVDERESWLDEWRDFWDDLGDAADKLWQPPAVKYVIYDSPIEHVGRWY